MISRIWYATATADGAERYEAHFRGSVLPELRSLAGFEQAYLLRREVDGHVEIQVRTAWTSMEAVLAFVGDPVDRAVVEPAAQAVLLQYAKKVAHYETQTFPAHGG